MNRLTRKLLMSGLLNEESVCTESASSHPPTEHLLPGLEPWSKLSSNKWTRQIYPPTKPESSCKFADSRLPWSSSALTKGVTQIPAEKHFSNWEQLSLNALSLKKQRNNLAVKLLQRSPTCSDGSSFRISSIFGLCTGPVGLLQIPIPVIWFWFC